MLFTTRLKLRPLNIADATAIQQLAGERSIADTTISIPHPYQIEKAEKYIQRKIAEQKTGCSATFAIEPKAKSNLTGIIELHDLELEHGVAELSYWLAIEAWGKGYMSEALPPVLDFGFKTLSLNRIQAYHMVRNQASGKVLLKNGFQLEGLLRQRVKKWNQYEDVKLYSLLRQEWQDS